MAETQTLAIHGGEQVRTEPMDTRLDRRFDEQELEELKEALDQQTLFYWFGEKVKTFCRQFAAMYGVKHCHMVTSGTAALHVANAAAGVGPGDEVVASPMTDQGTVISILAQGAVPIFADLDPHTYNVTAKNIEKCITKKTKAINVVHLAGNPADMDPILRLAKKRGLRLIEDCAQSYLCWYKGRLVGTMGDLGCFSLNDFKHISAGDAGMVLTNDDDLAARVQLFLDKGYARDGSGRQPPFLGFNYRPSELHGAVAIAQLRKLPGIVAQRNLLGDRLTQQLKGVPGIFPAKVQRGCKSSYWFYMGRMDPKRLGGIAGGLRGRGCRRGRTAQRGLHRPDGLRVPAARQPQRLRELELPLGRQVRPQSQVRPRHVPDGRGNRGHELALPAERGHDRTGRRRRSLRTAEGGASLRPRPSAELRSRKTITHRIRNVEAPSWRFANAARMPRLLRGIR